MPRGLKSSFLYFKQDSRRHSCFSVNIPGFINLSGSSDSNLKFEIKSSISPLGSSGSNLKSNLQWVRCEEPKENIRWVHEKIDLLIHIWLLLFYLCLGVWSTCHVVCPCLCVFCFYLGVWISIRKALVSLHNLQADDVRSWRP